MGEFLQSTNIEENFWQQNTEVKYISPFNKFHEEDDSKNKLESSKIMWALYLYSDPNSRFFKMGTEEKRKEISENFLETTEKIFDSKAIKDLIKAYEEALLSKLERSYNRLLKKLEERDNYISKTPYTEKNAKNLDAMLTNTSAIYKQIIEIGEDLHQERKAGNVKGGRKESLSERKEI